MQFFLEVLMEILGDVIWGALASGFDGKRPTTSGHYAGRIIAFVFVGITAGWISVELYPTHVLTNLTARRAWLVVSPLLSVCFVFLFHLIFFPRERRGWPMVHAAVLSASFNIWRFLALPEV